MKCHVDDVLNICNSLGFSAVQEVYFLFKSGDHSSSSIGILLYKSHNSILPHSAPILFQTGMDQSSDMTVFSIAEIIKM